MPRALSLPIPTLCFQAGFVVCSQRWYTDETCGVCCAFFISCPLALPVSLDMQTVLMCSLHISPYQVNCPGPLPHKIIEFAYFKQRFLTFHRSSELNIPYISWLSKEGQSSSLLSNWSTITQVVNVAVWFYWLSTQTVKDHALPIYYL